VNKTKESDVQLAASKSVYGFVAISVAFAFFSLLAGSLLIVDLLKNLRTTSMDAIHWAPLLISFVGFTFGFLAKEKAKNNKAFPEQGCAANLIIYSNVIIPLLYFVFLFGLGFVSYFSLD
jgi:hypothetical protein